MNIQDKKQRIAAYLVATAAALLLLWIVRNGTELPPAVPTTHYNTGALLMKDGSGCVNAAEQRVPCPPGTFFPGAAPGTSGPVAGGFSIKDHAPSTKPADAKH